MEGKCKSPLNYYVLVHPILVSSDLDEVLVVYFFREAGSIY
jgi:hypothetical protein